MFLLVASRGFIHRWRAPSGVLRQSRSTRTNIDCMNGNMGRPVQTGSNVMTNHGCDIKFEHVGFAYNTGETVLKRTSPLPQSRGEVTALLSVPPAEEKRRYPPCRSFWDIDEGGKITVGGMDISKIEPETLLSFYSIVFQDVTLFNNTVKEKYQEIGKKGRDRRGSSRSTACQLRGICKQTAGCIQQHDR